MRIAALGLAVLEGFAQDPAVAEWTLPSPVSAPRGIAVAANGAIWFSETGVNKIGRFDPTLRRIREWSLPTPTARPVGIACSSDGRVYVAEQTGHKIAAFDPATERFTEWDLRGPESGPYGIVEGPDSAMWFTEQRGNRIGRLDPKTGRVTSIPVPTPNAGPYGIAAAPRENAVYFTELDGHRLGRVDIASGTIAEFPTPTASPGARLVTVDRAGGIWITYSRAGKIARFDPTNRTFREYDAPGGPRGSPYAIGVDSAGHVWFSQLAVEQNNLVELDPATGRMTAVKVPTKRALVRGLAIDGSNAVWYVSNGQGKIGRLTQRP